MSAKNWRARQLEQATAELGYQKVAPPASTPVSKPPNWLQTTFTGPDHAAFQELIEREEWPVAEIREYISATGTKPRGRSRSTLAQQLAESFLAPEHIQAAQQALPDDTREIYLALVINHSLARSRESLYVLTAPPRQMQEYYHELIEAGLVIRRPNKLILPSFYAAPLPKLHFSHPWDAKERAVRQVKANPQRALTYLQQILGLTVGGEVQLRAQHRYKPQAWPLSHYLKGGLPEPASVAEFGTEKRIINRNSQLVFNMLPPAPLLTEQAINDWMKTLSLPQTGVEFFYHLLVEAQILRPGSPVKRETQYARQFLSLPAGKQLALMLKTYEQLTAWEVFWPLWREGKIRASWNLSRQHGFGLSYQHELSELLLVLRSAVLNLLAALPAERWLSIAQIGQVLTRYFPADYFFGSGHLSLGGRSGDEEWFLKLYLRAFLRGPLHWLGFADLEFAANGALVNFRLQHLQELLWQRLEAFPLPELEWAEKAGVRWEAETDTLWLSLPVPPALLDLVHRWAKPQGMEKGVLRYHPSQERLHALFEQGSYSRRSGERMGGSC